MNRPVARSVALPRSLGSHLHGEHVARRAVKYSTGGGPEHQPQAVPSVRTEDDEISTDLPGQMPNFDSGRANDYLHHAGIDEVNL